MNLEARGNLRRAKSFNSFGEFVIAPVVIARESIRHFICFALEPLAVELESKGHEKGGLFSSGFDSQGCLDGAFTKLGEV
jgi:hypothetical protein